MKKNNSILISNATSALNIGDAAMLKVLIKLLKVNEDNNIIVLSSEPKTYRDTLGVTFKSTLYHWVAFENTNFLIRSWRLMLTIIIYTLNRFNFVFTNKNKIQSIINDYTKSDLIVFAPGGYLRSKKGLIQSLNLMMLLFHFKIAKLSKAKKIVAPISFGPFAYKWQEKLASNVLSDLKLVYLRERYSYSLLKKYGLDNIILSSDLALFSESVEVKKNNDYTIGFTIRKWLEDSEQNYFENSFVKALFNFASINNVCIQPIVQVDAPKFGDNDALITENISKNLLKLGTNVLDTIIIKDVDHALETYGKIDLLIGMRMHSNILAAVQGVPFIAISYEYKTEGIAEQLGLKDYCIKVEDVNDKNLLELINKAYNNNKELKNEIKSNLSIIHDSGFYKQLAL